jgi:hypothetical protein
MAGTAATVMDDAADLVGSAADVACSEIFAGLGTVAGAV